MGQRVAHHLISANIIDYIELSEDHSIVEIKASHKMIGKNLKQLDIRARYGCNVIAIKTGIHMNIAPNAEDLIKEENLLVVVGNNEDLQEFEKIFAE
jgi:trk system potassium uptake protein TrkA